MLITSEDLMHKIAQISKEVDIKSNHACTFEEFVVVPFFGQIVLRFMLNKDDYSLEELDYYENMLNNIAGEDFLCDFMGSVYKNVGVDYSDIGQQLLRMNVQFSDEQVFDSSYSSAIKEDANFLLKTAGLDTDIPVWEIQAEDGEYRLLLMGKESKPIKNITEPITVSVCEVAEQSCTGLIKATVYCRRNHISLARVLISKES